MNNDSNKTIQGVNNCYNHCRYQRWLSQPVSRREVKTRVHPSHSVTEVLEACAFLLQLTC